MPFPSYKIRVLKVWDIFEADRHLTFLTFLKLSCQEVNKLKLKQDEIFREHYFSLYFPRKCLATSE